MASALLKSTVELAAATSVLEPIFDGVIVISPSVKALRAHNALSALAPAVESFASLHSGLENGSVNLIPHESLPSKRLIYASVGSVTKDFDDVRRYLAAGKNAARSALAYGVKSPLLVTVPYERFPKAELVAAIGALHPYYVPLQIRESDANRARKVDRLTVLPLQQDADKFVTTLKAIQTAFNVTRDIGDSDPQRMAPPRVAEYVEEVFRGTSVKVRVEADQERLLKGYPLLHAVNRCANSVDAHKARLIWLEYENTEKPTSELDFETLMLVGKGVTIDTGGTDLKTGGAMFGMTHDKYGAANVAGFFAALDALQPKGIKVVAYMSMVRNSIGANSYTCDEIIVARSGKRIHIYNTDAEGRLAMLDPLTEMREKAVAEKNPHLMTIATLTGHEVLTYGLIPAVMDNGPASATGHAKRLQSTGDLVGQPVEISRLHNEDFDFHNAESEHADLRQGNTKPSVQTLRGHMTPAAFLIRGSRLDEHGLDSNQPLKYSHLDIGAAMGEYPHVSFPSPLLTLIAHHILPRV